MTRRPEKPLIHVRDRRPGREGLALCGVQLGPPSDDDIRLLTEAEPIDVCVFCAELHEHRRRMFGRPPS